MPVIPSKFDHEHIRSIQMALNEKMESHLTTDGNFGPKSVSVLVSFQFANELPVTGAYDDATQVLLEPFIAHKYLTSLDYMKAAVFLKVTSAAIRTVVHVEANGDGFLDNGACVVLFERHKFYGYLAKKKSIAEMGKLRGQYPTIVNNERGGYSSGVKRIRSVENSNQY